jgi:hypothetical protein
MTTSSSDRSRCTRISPSAILDDQLSGKDLEWARDHLRRCEACRGRVEDFREMLLRVGRLPSATVSAAAMDQAFAAAIPERLRDSNGDSRLFETASSADLVAGPPPPFTQLAPLADLPPLNNFDPAPQSVRPEVTNIPDMLTELEREIFRDEPVPNHPAATPSVPEPAYVQESIADPPADLFDRVTPPHPEMDELAAASVGPPEPPLEPYREVPIDSHREWAPSSSFLRQAEIDEAAPASHYAVYDEPAPVASTVDDDEQSPVPPRKPDTAMRLAVGLGAAACVLLAAVLYEGGWVLRSPQKLATTASTVATATARASASAKPSLTPSPTAIATPTPLPALFTFANGVAGNNVFRIRPGTAVAGFTRLVFDMHGTGLPNATITAPDGSHVVVTFQGATATGLVVGGIHSYNIAGIEPVVQQGSDVSITVDLSRPARVTAFTLPQEPGYAWRLVVDLHTP